MLVLQDSRGVSAEALTQWLTVWADAPTATVRKLESGHDVFLDQEARAAVLEFLNGAP